MLLIGFGHRARQGKNTAAEAILSCLPLLTDVHLYAFGDALKAEVRRACAIFGGQFELIERFKESGIMPDWVHFDEPKPRSLLQWWGTDYRRAKRPNYWVDKLAATLDRHNPSVALITDVRFRNECDFIKARDGFLVRCVRTSEPDVDVEEHLSECALDSFNLWDYTITAATADECREKAVRYYLKQVNAAPTEQEAALRRIKAKAKIGLRVR